MTNGPRALAALPNPQAVLFDLDGTLVDTNGIRAEAWRLACVEFGLSVDPAIISPFLGSDGRWLARELGRSVGRDLDWAARDELNRLADGFFDHLNVCSAPLTGAIELLSLLEASRLTFAIATASQAGQVAVSVGALGLASRPPIIDAGHVEHAKPAPDLLLVAAAEIGVAPDGCWYVGDSTWDMMAANAAEMPGIGVATGATDIEGLIAAGARAAISGLPILRDELRRRCLVGPTD